MLIYLSYTIVSRAVSRQSYEIFVMTEKIFEKAFDIAIFYLKVQLSK